MTDSIRRSGRVRKQNPKYATDPADKIDLEGLGSASSDVDASSFEHDTDKNEEDTFMDEDSGSEDNDPATEKEDDSASEEELVGFSIESPSKITAKHPANRISKWSRWKHYAGYQEDGSRVRGCLFHPSVRNKNVTIHELAGDDQFFIDKIKAEKHKYVGTFTVPFRDTNAPGQSGLCHPEVYDDIVREAEKRNFLSWYEERQGWQTMAEAQSTQRCDLHSRKLYVDTELPPQDLLLGPYNAQHHFTLDFADSISVSQAWQTAISATENGDDYDENASDRSAWILNLGSRMLSMDWAPNQGGHYQYLAVSVMKPQPTDIPRVSSFEPSEPYEANVQIWAFSTLSNNGATLMDTRKKPKLAHVMCIKWGTVRRLLWCPAAVLIGENSKSIGLLATISTDGFIRVTDVCVDVESNNPYGMMHYFLLIFLTSVVKYEAAVFASKPPDTICTCLTWLSASQLAAGCANGHVAIWDIGKHIIANNSATKNSSVAVPDWYHALHTTYIISIIAHQPYPCQHITTNAVEGRVRVTSIRNPYPDTVYGSRERHLTPPLCAAPHILGFYEIDEVDGLRARSLRHIPISRLIGKATAQIMCMDAGKTHPCLLVGCADGNVFITNPLRKIFIRRAAQERMVTWQNTWFKHEFVPVTRLQPVDYSSSLSVDSERRSHVHPRKGTSRFLESFKVEPISMTRATQSSKDSNIADANVEDLPVTEVNLPTTANKQEQDLAAFEDVQISIYEEEQAVTCISWSPNVQTGGWAAAGMANGLLRVEDLAI